MSFTVTRKGTAERKSRQVEVAVRAGLVVIGNRVLLRLVDEQRAKAPDTIATGQTMRSHTASRVFKEGESLVIRIGPRTSYAKWGIETGRAPGTPPPLAAIQRWVREKPGGAGLTEQAQWAIARSVQKTIATHGTPPHKVLTTVLKKERVMAKNILRLAVLKALLS